MFGPAVAIAIHRDLVERRCPELMTAVAVASGAAASPVDLRTPLDLVTFVYAGPVARASSWEPASTWQLCLDVALGLDAYELVSSLMQWREDQTRGDAGNCAHPPTHPTPPHTVLHTPTHPLLLPLGWTGYVYFPVTRTPLPPGTCECWGSTHTALLHIHPFPVHAQCTHSHARTMHAPSKPRTAHCALSRKCDVGPPPLDLLAPFFLCPGGVELGDPCRAVVPGWLVHDMSPLPHRALGFAFEIEGNGLQILEYYRVEGVTDAEWLAMPLHTRFQRIGRGNWTRLKRRIDNPARAFPWMNRNLTIEDAGFLWEVRTLSPSLLPCFLASLRPCLLACFPGSCLACLPASLSVGVSLLLHSDVPLSTRLGVMNRKGEGGGGRNVVVSLTCWTPAHTPLCMNCMYDLGALASLCALSSSVLCMACQVSYGGASPGYTVDPVHCVACIAEALEAGLGTVDRERDSAVQVGSCSLFADFFSDAGCWYELGGAGRDGVGVMKHMSYVCCIMVVLPPVRT